MPRELPQERVKVLQILKQVLLQVSRHLPLPKEREVEGEGLLKEQVGAVDYHSLHHRRKERVKEEHYHQVNLREHRGEQMRNWEVEVKLLQPTLILPHLQEVGEGLNQQGGAGQPHFLHLQMMEVVVEKLRLHRLQQAHLPSQKEQE